MTRQRSVFRGQGTVSTHMPLARHDGIEEASITGISGFYSHASCEA